MSGGGTLNLTTSNGIGPLYWLGDGHTMAISSGGKVNFYGISGSFFTSPSNAVINVTGAGSQLNANDNNGIYIYQGGQLNVTSGGAVAAATIGLGATGGVEGNGTAIFDGAGSSLTLTTTSQSQFGYHAVGTLTLRNNASGNISSPLALGVGDGGTGIINVQSGASLNTSHIDLGDRTYVTASGTINVSGATLTQTGTGYLTVGAASASSGTLNVSSGGTFNTASGIGTTVNALGAININGATFNERGSIFLYGATVTLTNGGLLSVTPFSTNINSGSTINITDSTANLNSLTFNGGMINFNSGVLSFSGNLAVGLGGLLGSNVTLDFSKSLTLTGTTTINAQHELVLSGGSFSTGSMVNNGTFTFDSGVLSITGGGGMTIASTGTLVAGDGRLNATGGITNNGEIRLAGTAPRISGGALTNNKLIRGDGRIDNAVTNASAGEIRAESGKTLLFTGVNGASAGKINLQGGTVEFSQAMSNGAAGVISGRGLFYADGGLTNNGQVQLSAGFTDFYGSLTSSSGSKVIVSGAGTATFYNPITLAGGSEFRVSAGGSAVFFGPVSGTSTFTGTGTKFFEGGSSSLAGPIDPGGTTIVDSSASVTAGAVREAALTINGGQVTISPNGSAAGTSRVANLSISAGGRLDLTNNKLIVAGGDVGSFVGSSYTGVTGLIAGGRNGGTDGNWSGSGIVTSSASGNLTSLAVATGQQTGRAGGTFGGISVAAGDVLVMYTYGGDANLDGKINVDDYGRIDFNVPIGTNGWFNGDFNYDGKINVDDYGIIDFNVGIQGAPFAVTSEIAATPRVASLTAVPEPCAMGLLVLSGGLMLRRRRR